MNGKIPGEPPTDFECRMTRRVLLAFIAAIAVALAGCGRTADTSRSGSEFGRGTQTTTPKVKVYIPPEGPPPIVGKAAIVIDNRTGRVLYAKNADERRAVASTQKLLTGLIIVESGNLNETVTIDKSDTYEEPFKLYLKAGDRYSKRQLLDGLLIRSGNDVAHALARHQAGSEPAFANMMNQRARQLGMRNSHFVKSNGLPASGQYSTARDMSIVARAALRHPIIPSITKNTRLSFRFSSGKVTTYTNTNKLLTSSPYCFGLKTGYTRRAGKCLISAGTYRDRTVIVVILGSNSSSIWNDSKKLLHWGLGVS
jgi:D-alanyl-D-alanine carboxypeptidase (penicillin-binding protein 5/6)